MLLSRSWRVVGRFATTGAKQRLKNGNLCGNKQILYEENGDFCQIFRY